MDTPDIGEDEHTLEEECEGMQFQGAWCRILLPFPVISAATKPAGPVAKPYC